ncbi:MAG: hypothetical protein WC091_02735 [Sulfuricellaceae bacterium]
MLLVALIIAMACLARMSGGGLGMAKVPSKFHMLPEAVFGLVFGAAACWNYGIYAGIAGTVLSAAAMQSSTGLWMHMGALPATAQSGRKQTLSRVVDPICARFRWPLGGWQYCWLFGAIKGLLIGLAAYPIGLLLAVLWPASYWLGQLLNMPKVKELLSGACAGLCIWLTL